MSSRTCSALAEDVDSGRHADCPLVVVTRIGCTAIFLATVVLSVSVALVGQSPPRGRAGDVETDVRLFYQARGDRPVWVDEQGRPTADAEHALARLRAVDEDGLVPGDYRISRLANEATALTRAERPSATDTAAFDTALTHNVLKYFRELHLGRVSARDLGFAVDHIAEPNEFPERLHTALATHSLDRSIDDLRPPFVQYQALREALKRYRTSDPTRVRQIELALERLRWLPDLKGQRLLVVNIPMFYVWGWEPERPGGVPAIGMAAIIGRAARTRTPIFTASMTSIILNPDWNVPQSIIRNEILPALSKNPRYLASHHMEMTSTAAGVRVRQLPGPWNALGRVKFVFPNIHEVYLHDTPAQELFARTRRDFSHGCVRVEQPIELAEWVLQGQGDWTTAQILGAIDAGATRSVALARPIRVVVFYVTAAVEAGDGAVRFADDIYHHDARLDARLRARTDGGE